MTTFTWIPDQGATKAAKPLVNIASFGDGYEQRSADGINTNRSVWTVAFSNRTKDEIDAIDSFLGLAKGVSYFFWLTPKGDTFKFKCDTWTTSYNHDGDASATATFTQVFDI